MARFKYNSKNYKDWRNAVYKRDRFKCQLCGERGSLNAHHIKPKSRYPKAVYKKNNGITLCVKCHNLITTKEDAFAPLLRSIIDRSLDLDILTEYMNRIQSAHPLVWEYFDKAEKLEPLSQNLIKKIKNFKNGKNRNSS